MDGMRSFSGWGADTGRDDEHKEWDDRRLEWSYIKHISLHLAWKRLRHVKRYKHICYSVPLAGRLESVLSTQVGWFDPTRPWILQHSLQFSVLCKMGYAFTKTQETHFLWIHDTTPDPLVVVVHLGTDSLMGLCPMEPHVWGHTEGMVGTMTFFSFFFSFRNLNLFYSKLIFNHNTHLCKHGVKYASFTKSHTSQRKTRTPSQAHAVRLKWETHEWHQLRPDQDSAPRLPTTTLL